MGLCTRKNLLKNVKDFVRLTNQSENLDVTVRNGEFTCVVRAMGSQGADATAVFDFVREGKQSPKAEWKLLDESPRLKAHGTLLPPKFQIPWPYIDSPVDRGNV